MDGYDGMIQAPDMSKESEKWLSDCQLCPRACHVDRMRGERGFCGEGARVRCARAALHLWEEPVLSGTRGSGAVFFSGCSLKCVFCQNAQISLEGAGWEVSPERLSEIFLELQEKGAHNIDLITGASFLPQIREALLAARDRGLTLPVAYNSGGYESPEALRLLEGLVQIYLPDVKYFSPELSAGYSHAPDYFERAMAALEEMFRQVGEPVLSKEGILQRGMVVRHLVLPGQTKDSKKVLRSLYETYGDRIYISILNQYTPMPGMTGDLARRVTQEEYDRVVTFARRLGISRGFVQEETSADEAFIPAFDGTGL